MNSREKEVLQTQLDSEKAVLKQLEKQYEQAMQDIDDKIKILQADELTTSKIYQIEYQEALKGQVSGILEKLRGDEYSTIQQYLSESYTTAYVGTMYSIAGQGIPIITPIDQAAAVKAIQLESKIKEGLYESIGIDAKALKKSIASEITRGISTNMSYDDMARNIREASRAPLSRAKTIARTEAHRIQQASADDARMAAKAKGANVVKQWDATLDGETRKTHRMLDGKIVEVEERFEIGTKKARFPGDFGDPAEDCNCRCTANTRARWALDADELATLKERSAYFGLDKTEDFADFSKKYLKAAEFKAILGDGSVTLDPVTKSSYKKLSNNIPDTWDEAQKPQLEKAFSDLLKDVETVDVGVECGAVYSMDMQPLKSATGDTGTVNIVRYDEPYIAMHNHPDGLIFSGTDVESFIVSPNLNTLFAIGNDGSVYMIQKTDDYDAAKFLKEYAKTGLHDTSNYETPEKYVNAMREFLKGSEKYGVKFYEG